MKMRGRTAIVALMGLSPLLAGCLGAASEPDAIRVGDEYLYRSVQGGWPLRIVVGPTVAVQDLEGATHEAVALRFGTADAAGLPSPEDVLFIHRGSGTVFAGLLGCTLEDRHDLASCVDLRSLVFQDAGLDPPLLFGVATYAHAAASEGAAFTPSSTGSDRVYGVSPAEEDPVWGACVGLDPIGVGENEPHAGYASILWSQQASITLCSRSPAPAAIRIPGLGDLRLEAYAPGSGGPAFPSDPHASLPVLRLDGFERRGVLPPEGDGPVDAFPIHEAYEHAVATDPDFAAFLADRPDAVLRSTTQIRETTALAEDNATRLARYVRTLELGAPGAGEAYSVDVEKTTRNGTRVGLNVTRSGLRPADPAVPARLPPNLLSLSIGRGTAGRLVPSAFASLDVRGWAPDFGGNRTLLDDRYHYEYFFEGPESKGIQFLASVVFDAADGRLLVMRAPSAAIGRFVPL